MRRPTDRQRTRWIGTASAVPVATAFLWLGKHIDEFAWGQQILLLIAAYIMLDVLFVQRWPRAELLRKALRLKPGQRVEAEGRPGGQLRARQEGR